MGHASRLKKQKKEADALVAKMNADKNQDGNAAVAIAPEEIIPEVSTPEDVFIPDAIDEVIPAEEIKTAAGLTPKEAVKSDGDLVHELSVARGMLKKVNDEKGSLTELVEELQANVLELLKAKNENSANQPQSAPVVPISQTQGSLVTSDQLNEFDPELLSFIKNVAGDVLAGASNNSSKDIMDIKAAVNSLSSRMEAMGNTVQETGKQTYSALLIDRIPDFNAINDSAELEIWAEEKDPFSGRTRKEVIFEAHNAGDIDRMVSMFDAFRKDHGLTVQAETPGSDDPRLKQVVPELSGNRTVVQSLKSGPAKISVAQLEGALKALEAKRRTNKITMEVYKKQYAGLLARVQK